MNEDAKIDIVAAVAEGRYANTLNRHEDKAAYRVEGARLHALLRADLERLHGTGGHPESEDIFNEAWEESNTDGIVAVASAYTALAKKLKIDL